MTETENKEIINCQDFAKNNNEQLFSEDEDFEYTSSEKEDLEKEYFGEAEEESVSDKGAWEDSESGEEALREKHKSTPIWINDKKPKRVIEFSKKKLSYRFDRYIFKSNFNIKILKKCGTFIVVVDTMNIVYLLQDNQLVKSFKIERFRIDYAVGFNDRIYLINSRCGQLKEIDSELEIDNVEKKIARNMRKGYANEYLYIMGDTTVVLNNNLNCITEYHDKFISMKEFQSRIVAINSSGDLLVLTKELKLEKKLVFDEGASFTDLYTSFNYLVINTKNSVIFLDSNFKIIKDASHIKNPVKNIVILHDHFFCFSSAKGGLKILDIKLHFNNAFPKKKIRLPDISLAISCNEGIYISSYRDLYFLRIMYE